MSTGEMHRNPRVSEPVFRCLPLRGREGGPSHETTSAAHIFSGETLPYTIRGRKSLLRGSTSSCRETEKAAGERKVLRKRLWKCGGKYAILVYQM